MCKQGAIRLVQQSGSRVGRGESMVDVWSGEPAAECGEAVSRLHVYSELLPHLQLMRCWVCLNQVNVKVGKSYHRRARERVRLVVAAATGSVMISCVDGGSRAAQITLGGCARECFVCVLSWLMWISPQDIRTNSGRNSDRKIGYQCWT